MSKIQFEYFLSHVTGEIRPPVSLHNKAFHSDAVHVFKHVCLKVQTYMRPGNSMA